MARASTRIGTSTTPPPMPSSPDMMPTARPTTPRRGMLTGRCSAVVVAGGVLVEAVGVGVPRRGGPGRQPGQLRVPFSGLPQRAVEVGGRLRDDVGGELQRRGEPQSE